MKNEAARRGNLTAVGEIRATGRAREGGDKIVA